VETTNHITTPPRHANEYHWADSAWFRWLLISAIGLGIFFRLAGLGTKMYSHDETYTSMYAAGYRTGSVFTTLWDGQEKTVAEVQAFLQPAYDRTLIDTLSVIARSGPQQSPLFYMLAHYWMRFIGYTPAALRGLAVLFGLLSIPAMYVFSRELTQSRPTALLATVLFAVSPFHILFSQDARNYSIWALATFLSSAALLRAIRTARPTAWALYCLTLILGIYSHQLFILVIVVHGLYLLIPPFNRSLKGSTGFLLSVLFALLAFLPWLFFMITRWQSAAGQLDWVNIPVAWFRYIQRWLLIFSSPLVDLDFNSDVLNLVPYFVRAVILLFVAYAFIYLLKNGSKQEKWFLTLIYLITAGTFIFLDLALGGMRSVTGRYFVPANLATVVVVASFLAKRLEQASPGESIRWRSLLGLLVTIALLSNLNSLRAETWWSKELSRVKTEFIREIDKEHTLLIVSGIHPTNLGDVLLLSFEVSSDIRFSLYRDPGEVSYPDNYRNVYWFPASYDEVQEVGEKKGLQVTEVLEGVLWRIDGRGK
jgi:uncharacterized membrane protein